MTFTNTKKTAIAFDSKLHDIFVSDIHLCSNGVYVARIKGEKDHVVWVTANKCEATGPQLDMTPIEPIQVAMAMQLPAKTWEQCKSEIARAARRRLRYIARCLRYGHKIEKVVK